MFGRIKIVFVTAFFLMKNVFRHGCEKKESFFLRAGLPFFPPVLSWIGLRARGATRRRLSPYLLLAADARVQSSAPFCFRPVLGSWNRGAAARNPRLLFVPWKWK